MLSGLAICINFATLLPPVSDALSESANVDDIRARIDRGGFGEEVKGAIGWAFSATVWVDVDEELYRMVPGDVRGVAEQRHGRGDIVDRD